MEFKTNRFLHGGDYNPEQWLDRPDILAKDIEMLKESGCNTVSVGIFSWSTLEPEEGVFNFEWMENVINNLYKNGISVILATPSGARPKWMTDKYQEVLRVDANRHRNLFGARHNHCYTSPVYREKTHIINKKLAERFGKHPAVILWHVSNEYGGECHCPLCQEEFRKWLKERYRSIEVLNKKWSTTFWSHTYQSFDQIESPSPRGESSLHALNLDWKRFVTARTRDFLHHEIESIREGGSDLPVTANLMYDFKGLNYFELAKEIDVVSWDTYPDWHKRENIEIAYDNGMFHDQMRTLKGKPFFQMESCPSSPNWKSVSKLRAPGVVYAQSMQAIAHGGEGAMYFQIRQSQGSSEKFHGAVIDHYGGNDTRVFREISRIGADLKKISEVTGSLVKSDVAIVYDLESRWAMEDSQGPRNKDLFYHETTRKYYRAFRKQGISVDMIDMTCSLDSYKIVVAPMLYMFRDGFEEKVRRFTEAGGIFVLTYWSGIADETDRCFLGGTPFGLMDVMGFRSEEIDGLFDWESNCAVPVEGNRLGIHKNYECKNLCELAINAEAEVLMTYGKDFYAGYPALTCHKYGNGQAWYVAADFEEAFQEDLAELLLSEAKVSNGINGKIPAGIEITVREKEDCHYYFYQNFSSETVQIPFPQEKTMCLAGNNDGNLKPYDLIVLKSTTCKYE